MNKKCFVCGNDRNHVLDEHHVVPQRYGGSDKDSNLVTLCATCHRAIESIYNENFYNRLGIDKSNQNISNVIWKQPTTPSDISKGNLVIAHSSDKLRLLLRCETTNGQAGQFEFYRLIVNGQKKFWNNQKIDSLINKNILRIYTGDKPPIELVKEKKPDAGNTGGGVILKEKYDPWIEA